MYFGYTTIIGAARQKITRETAQNNEETPTRQEESQIEHICKYNSKNFFLTKQDIQVIKTEKVQNNFIAKRKDLNDGCSC